MLVKCLTAKRLKQGYRYHKLRKAFPSSNVDTMNCFKIQSEPEFHGYLVYKFNKNMGRTDFSDQFCNIIIRHKHIGFNL